MLPLGSEGPSLPTKAPAAVPPHPQRPQRVVRLRGGLRAPWLRDLHVQNPICKSIFGGVGGFYSSSKAARGPAKRSPALRELTGQWMLVNINKQRQITEHLAPMKYTGLSSLTWLSKISELLSHLPKPHPPPPPPPIDPSN